MDVVKKAKDICGDKVGQSIDFDTLSLVLQGHVLSRLNRDDVPPGLEPIMAYMLADYAKMMQANDTGSTEKITSIARGDTTIEYAIGATSPDGPLQSVLSKWSLDLSRWKKARGIRRA